MAGWAPPEAAADFVQDIFVTLVQQLPRFQHDGTHVPCLAQDLASIAGEVSNRKCDRRPPINEATCRTIPGVHRANYLKLEPAALESCAAIFKEHGGRAGRPSFRPLGPGRANELGMSVGAVYVAKSRVLARLREELAGLLE